MTVDVENQNPNSRNCLVKVLKLQEAKGDYKNSDIAEETITPVKSKKEDKKAKTPKAKTPKTPKGKKDGKSQMKISGFFTPKGSAKKTEDDSEEKVKTQMKISGFFTPKSAAKKTDEDTEEEELVSPAKNVVEATEERKRITSGDSDSRPDSGFASRAETPAVWSEAGSKAGSPHKEEEAEEKDVQKEKDAEDSEEESEKESSSEEESESDWDGDSDDGFKKAAKKPAPKKVKGKAARARAALNKPVIIPGAMKSELNAYEQIRHDNIKEREAMLAALMADFQEYKQDAGIANAKKPAQKRKRRLDDDGSAFRTSVGDVGRRKSSRLAEQPEGEEKPLGSQVWDAENKEFKEYKLAEEQSDYDEQDYQNHEVREKKKNTAHRGGKDPNEGFLMPEDITPSMLKKIGTSLSSKVYNQNIGTTCHQCRQKTVDTKTICRSGECVGVRGQFCGRCLEIRYGEDAKEALMDPHWKCPPCRNFCNCSICRNRNGKGATGMLIQLAQAKGFDNVADYLKHLTNKKGTDEFDE
eukprot:TRINITY_DN3001_c0_g2_i1.p1 TRINITY_DN3001_c0_g2~~TRINITY_DN3001_c0_g2_i1.p1  ORF type:complete len:526 (-),score=213.35 TRINITY_DN3001_c0_g2_i1:279-1856(-)